MTTSLRLRRGTTTQHSTFTGGNGEVTVDTTKKTVVVHDGTTAGGTPLATEAAVNAKQNADSELTTLAGMSANRASFVASEEHFGFRNRIINGNMRIDQRNAGASVTPTGEQYITDRWRYVTNQASKFTAQQNQGSVTPPTGFTNYLGFASSSSYSIGSSDYFLITQTIEGLNIADLAWGTANAAPVSLSFWVRSSLTGTFGGQLENNAGNPTYPFSYTINSANTWEQKTLTIVGPTTGTWLTTNGAGIVLRFSLGTGSSFTGTANAWSSSRYFAPTGQVNVAGTNGATFYITGVQLEKGSTATSFDYRPYGTELALCQRYFMSYLGGNLYARAGQGTAYATTAAVILLQNPVPMRANPTYAYTGNIRLYDGVNAETVTSFSIDSSDTTLGSLAANVASGLTVSRYYQLLSWNNTTARVTASAEL